LAPKRGPHRFADYRETHETVMGQLVARGFVLSEDLTFSDLGNDAIQIEGTIQCLGNLRVEVKKVLAILSGQDADAIVQSTEYSYNAISGGEHRVFSYHSPHLTHHRMHHVHRAVGLVGEETVTEVAPEGDLSYPTLGEVVRELEVWYWEHRDQLDEDQPQTRARPTAE
jgi:hypothetical protein